MTASAGETPSSSNGNRSMNSSSTPNPAPPSAPSPPSIAASGPAAFARMTPDEELALAARLRELRRDLVALALIDPASRAELERIAADVAARRLRIEAVVDDPELTPHAAQQRFDEFRAAAARLRAAPPEGLEAASEPPARDAAVFPVSRPPAPAGEALGRALGASRALAATLDLQWDCAERVLQHSWLDAGGSPPPGLANHARRQRGEIDAIVQRFVATHQGLVASVSRQYRGLGLSQEDLMQDGNIGLLRALEKFDERRGNPFRSYAVWWVRESMRRALAQQGRTIRLPAHAIAKRHAIGKASRRLAHELGRDPSAQELSSAVGMAPESIDDVIRVSREPLSLDAPRAGDTEGTLGDVIADRHGLAPSEHATARESADHLQTLLASLTARERRVLSLRFGLDGGDEQTLEEIGRSLELTRERVRQIVAGALDKLHRATRARRLEL